MKDMKTYNYMAVDVGATSGRVMLASYDGAALALEEVGRFPNPMIPMSGHLFWDIPFIYNEILKALKIVADKGVEVSSIGIDTWGCDFAFFGSDGRLLGLPYCYRDPHTCGTQERFFERMPAEEVYGRTGIQFMDFNSIFQLDTLKRDGCQALEHADKILFVPDALIYMLTGKAVCEYTVASTSQMLDPRTGELDGDILKALGIQRERFGKMVCPGTVVGTLSGQVQEATGMGAVPVVAVAGHDTGSAVVAVPAVGKEYAYLSCGTWSLLGIESEKPIITEESYRENFTNEGGVEGTTRFLKNICGLWLFEQCRKEFKDAPSSVQELAALCETSRFDGFIYPDAECFANPVSMVSAIREYCASTGQAVPEAPGDFCRCIFRSLAMRYRQVVEVLEGMCGFPIRTLHVIGGGSKNNYLMQYAANALNRPVVCGPVEGTAIGNVLMQMKSMGLAGSLDEMRRISASSIEPVTYHPADAAEWDAEYERYLKVTINHE